jgi:hypothetical protein
LCQVELHITDVNSAVLGIVLNLMVQVGVIEKSFRWDAANVQASSTECSTLFNTCHLEPFLAGLDGSDISSDTATDDDQVLLLRLRGI